MQLHILKAGTEGEIDAAFATVVEIHAGRPRRRAAIDSSTAGASKLVGLAAHHAIPAIWEWRDFVVAGGLISYGITLRLALARRRDPRFSPKNCFRAIWRRNFAGGKRKRFAPAHLRAKTRAGSVPAGLFGGGANFGRESRYSNGLRRHFPAPRPRREESAAREDRRRARRRSLGRPPFPGANRGISTACGAISGRDATRGRAGARCGPQLGRLRLSATQALSAFCKFRKARP